MRKLLCKLFNKHNYVKTGANQYGYYGYCKYCGKRYFAHHLRHIIGTPVNPTLPMVDIIPEIANIETIDKRDIVYKFKTIKKLPKNFGKIK